jgi:hypothetical protein
LLDSSMHSVLAHPSNLGLIGVILLLALLTRHLHLPQPLTSTYQWSNSASHALAQRSFIARRRSPRNKMQTAMLRVCTMELNTPVHAQTSFIAT